MKLASTFLKDFYEEFLPIEFELLLELLDAPITKYFISFFPNIVLLVLSFQIIFQLNNVKSYPLPCLLQKHFKPHNSLQIFLLHLWFIGNISMIQFLIPFSSIMRLEQQFQEHFFKFIYHQIQSRKTLFFQISPPCNF
jgi:hypothetical protein